MDVTSLLNQSSGSSGRKAFSRESTPPSTARGSSTLPSTALPTPSPETTPPPNYGEAAHIRGRTPWSAGGYSLPLQIAPKLRSTSTSISEQFDSDASYDLTPGTSMHSRNGSIDSDVVPPREMGFLPRPELVRCVEARVDECECAGNVKLTQSLNSAATTDPGSRRAATCERRCVWATMRQLHKFHSREADAQHFQTPTLDCQTHLTDEIRVESGDERLHENDRNVPSRHKFSDSSSSLSSYSSWQSKSHSRISSVTTVGGPPSLGSSLADRPIFESKGGESEDAANPPRRLHAQSSSSATSRHRLPEHRESDELERPGSPSDAVLLMKTPSRNHPTVAGSPWYVCSFPLSHPPLLSVIVLLDRT